MHFLSSIVLLVVVVVVVVVVVAIAVAVAVAVAVVVSDTSSIRLPASLTLWSRIERVSSTPTSLSSLMSNWLSSAQLSSRLAIGHSPSVLF